METEENSTEPLLIAQELFSYVNEVKKSKHYLPIFVIEPTRDTRVNLGEQIDLSTLLRRRIGIGIVSGMWVVYLVWNMRRSWDWE